MRVVVEQLVPAGETAQAVGEIFDGGRAQIRIAVERFVHGAREPRFDPRRAILNVRHVFVADSDDQIQTDSMCENGATPQ